LTSLVAGFKQIENSAGDLLNSVYTIQPVVKPGWQPVGQQVVSCTQTSNRLPSRLYNRGCSIVQPVGQPV